MEKVDEFIGMIIDEKGIEVEPGKREILRDFLKKTLLERIDEAVLNELDDDDAEELDNLSNNDGFSAEMADVYLREHGVNVERVALAAMLKFREDVLATTISPAMTTAKKEA